jgi:hypothetical protein
MASLISPLIQHMYQNHMAMPFGDCFSTHVESVYFEFSALGNNQAVVGKPIYFASNPDLDGNNSIITGIECVSNQKLTNLPTNAGAVNLNQDEISRATLTISNPMREEIAIIPCFALIRGVASAATTFQSQAKNNAMFWIDSQLWQNCYVTFNQIFGAIGVGAGMYFNVYYIKKK